ncbi:uncharacterized protein LOC143255410 [Tachypleus tridentatus]|uniref:uncharacterized protein LOC143255410 n=1 Tax=Tachypleus tridentatus TaxID=6853 RepID=UPI003FD501AC
MFRHFQSVDCVRFKDSLFLVLLSIYYINNYRGDSRKQLLKELTSTPLQTERIHPRLSLSCSSSISDCSSGISSSYITQLAPCLDREKMSLRQVNSLEKFHKSLVKELEHLNQDMHQVLQNIHPPRTPTVPSLGLPYVPLSHQLTRQGKDSAVPVAVTDERPVDGPWSMCRSSSVDHLLGQAWKECFGDCLAPVLPRPASGAEAIRYSLACFNQSISSNLSEVQSSQEMWRVRLQEMRKKLRQTEMNSAFYTHI